LILSKFFELCTFPRAGAAIAAEGLEREKGAQAVRLCGGRANASISLGMDELEDSSKHQGADEDAADLARDQFSILYVGNMSSWVSFSMTKSSQRSVPTAMKEMEPKQSMNMSK